MKVLVFLLVLLSLVSYGHSQITASLGQEVRVVEGGVGGSTVASFPIRLSEPVITTSTVTFTVWAGTATAGVDYLVPLNNTVTFLAGSALEYIRIPIVGDTLVENTETFDVVLGAGSGISISFPPTGRGYIVDDDGVGATFTPTTSVREAVSVVSFTVTLQAASTVDVSFSYRAYQGENNTATPGIDYDNAVGTVTIKAGSLSGTGSVNIFDDTLTEGDETFTLEIYNPNKMWFVGPTGAAVTSLTSTITIVDDDVTLVISSVSRNEGTGTNTAFVFTVGLSTPLITGQSAVIEILLIHGTTNAADFVDLSVNGTILSFAAGDSAKTVTVTVSGDSTVETTETFQVYATILSSVPASVIQSGYKAIGTGTIVNDDSTLSIAVTRSNTATTLKETDGSIVFTITPSGTNVGGPAGSYTINANSGTALNTLDYKTSLTTNTLLLGTQTVSWAAGVTPPATTFTVTVLQDLVGESNETFGVEVTSLNNVIVTGTSSWSYIITDTTVFLSVGNAASVLEGNGGSAPNNTLLFPVTLSRASTSDITFRIQYDTTVDTQVATFGTDYFGPTNFTVTAGVTTVNIPITIVGDSNVELNEAVTFSLTGIPTTIAVGINTAQGIIQNDDIYVYLGDVTVSEGDVGTTDAVLRVYSPDPFPAGSTLTFFTPPTIGTATSDSDYRFTQSSVALPVGLLETFITVSVLGDTDAEATETFRVEITAGGGGTSPGVPSYGTVTIVNDDGPSLSVADMSALESSGSMVFTLVLDSPAVAGSSVSVSTGNLASASPGGDFVVVRNSTVNFAAGATSVTFNVTLLDDTVAEPTETFTLLFSTPNFIRVPPALLPSGRVVNDDGIRVGLLNTGAYSLPEGNSGITNFVFVVGPVGSSVGINALASVRFETIAGTATPNSDYVPISAKTVEIGATPVTVTVQVIGDTTPEPTETFQVRMYYPDYVFFNSPATIDLSATANILGDDYFVNISSVSGLEGNTGDPTTKFVFRVLFSGPASAGSTLTYSTVDGTALSSSSANDYVAIPSTTVTVATGSTDYNITVNVVPDNTPEGNDTFSVSLTGAYLLNIGTPSLATGTIINDDFTLTITDQSIFEGDTSSVASFTYLIDGPAPAGSTFRVQTQDSTAKAGINYVALNQTFNLTTGVTSVTINVTILGDTLPGPSTVFNLVFSSVSKILLSATTAKITIINDDGPIISIASASALEGNTTAQPLVFVVSASGPVTAGAGFLIQTKKVTTSVGDFVEVSAPVFVNFTAGATSVSVTINTIPDTTTEDTETFELVITNPSQVKFPANTTAAGISAVGTITNDDGLGVSIPALFKVEGTSATPGATTAFVFQVNLVGGTAPAGASINFTIRPGTASYPSDYNTTSGVISFTTGASFGTATVLVFADSVDEPQETFSLFLNTPNKVNIQGFTNATATISNDDAILSFSPAKVVEGASGTTSSLVFNLSLSSPAPPSPGLVSFTWTTVDVTATAGVDYTAAASTFTMAAGSTTGTITITVLGDDVPESDEILQLNITSVTNAVAPVTLVDGTILNDDLQLNVVNQSFYERDATYAYKFPIFQTVPAPNFAVVTYNVTSISAVSGRDFILLSNQSLTVNTNDNVTYIDFSILADLVPQGDKLFRVTLTGCTGCVVGGSSTATVTLWEDDYSMAFSAPTYTVTETESTFNLTISLVASQPLITAGPNPEITVSTADGTAISGSDYTARSTTFRFSSGDSSATFTVPILGDTVSEPTETFTVSMSTPVGLKIGSPSSTTVTILDNDARLIRVSHPRVLEGGDARAFEHDINLNNLTFVVSLSGPAVAGSSVVYATADGSANSLDYLSVNGTYNFTAGQTSFNVVVPVIADFDQEPTETVFLNILSFTGSLKVDSETNGVGSIVNDDFKAFGVHGVVRGQLRINNREVA